MPAPCQFARRSILFAILACCTLESRAQAPDPATVTPEQTRKWADEAARLALAEARTYDIRIGKEAGEAARLKLVEQPVLKWSNVYEASVYGGAFVWTRDGRPEVIACMFKFYTTKVSFDAEFHSLAAEPITAVKNGEVVWQPATAGTQLNVLADAPPPAKTAAGRLTQMRDLARGFSGELTTVIEPKTKHGLRLLPQPLLRYGGESKELLDGALFAFARATDPEVILMIEARGADSPRWEFALARMHVGELTAAYRDKQVWSVDELKHPYLRKTAPYTLFQHLTEPK